MKSKFFLWGALAACLGACHAPRVLSEENQRLFSLKGEEDVKRHIVVGKTTKQEVKALFGEPKKFKSIDEHKTRYTYRVLKSTPTPDSMPFLNHLNYDNKEVALEVFFKDDVVSKCELNRANVKSTIPLDRLVD